MSSSPEKTQVHLQGEIERRISQGSPVKYDLDFYMRKITRLENDFNGVQDQLSKAKVKLRRAEDFQIKYDILLKQNANMNNDLEKKDQCICELKEKNEYFQAQLNDHQNKGQDWSTERRSFQDEIDYWKNKYEEAEDQRNSEIYSLKTKCDELIKKQHQVTRRDFSEREQQYQFQIRQLKKAVHEKQTVQNVIQGRVDKIRKEKDEQIARLGRIIEKNKSDHLQSMQEKNEEFDKLREKFEKMFNFQLENLKKNLDNQDQMFHIELTGLQEMITLKNDQIAKLLDEIKKRSLQYDCQKEQLQTEVKILKEKIYEIERQNQLQLYNLKERLTKIHSVEVKALEKRYQDLINTLRTDREEIEKLVKEKDRMIGQQRKQVERVKEELMDRIKERDGRIQQLQDRIKNSGENNAVEIKNLHESLHKIESQKQLMTSEYQTNVGFLNQQIAKLTSGNELKNNEIKELHQEIANMKRNYADNVKDLQLKWKQQRKERQDERQRQRERKQRVEDQFMGKERQWRSKERMLEREREKQEREKKKLKFICEEHEKDIQRLNEYVKQLDESLRKEFKKNQTSTLDIGGVRRELTGELQRQKSELEALKRMEVDQIQKKYEIEVSRLTNQNEKLQTELLNKSIAYENLESQFKKLDHVNKNIDKINKEKMVEYQKKMATLNNEINVTQNLYQAFLDAKSRGKKRQ